MDDIRHRHGNNIFLLNYRGEEQTLRRALSDLGETCEILEGEGEESLYRSLKIHVRSDEEVRRVIAATNQAVDLRSFREVIPSMNDIFIRAVQGNL